MKTLLAAAEAYPSSERWGDLGWTYNEINDARGKFLSLVEAANEKTGSPG